MNPRTSPAEVNAQVDEFLRGLAAEDPELKMDWEMYGSTPGGAHQRTAGSYSLRAACPEEPDLSRALGVPTVRMGWPWPAEGAPENVAEGLGGMGATYIPDLIPCAEKILRTVIDTCTRPRTDVLP